MYHLIGWYTTQKEYVSRVAQRHTALHTARRFAFIIILFLWRYQQRSHRNVDIKVNYKAYLVDCLCVRTYLLNILNMMGCLRYNTSMFRFLLAYINKVLKYWHTFPCTVCLLLCVSTWSAFVKTSIIVIACRCFVLFFAFLGFIVRDYLCIRDRNKINKQKITIVWWDISALWICDARVYVSDLSTFFKSLYPHRTK